MIRNKQKKCGKDAKKITSQAGSWHLKQSGENNMNKKPNYVVALMATMMLVMVAMTTMAGANETTIGDIESYTPGYEQVDAKQRYTTGQWMQDGNWDWTIEWEYNAQITGTITDVKVRGHTENNRNPTDYFLLHINGKNVGSPDALKIFTNDAAGPSATQSYWHWEDLNVDVKGTVLFEMYKVPDGESPKARIYTGRSGTALGTDVDGDGDMCSTSDVGIQPNNRYENRCFVGSTEYANNKWQNVDTDIIYEFTYTDTASGSSPSSPPSTPSETTNHEPDKPTIKTPADGATNVDSQKPIRLSVEISDRDEDPLRAYFYLKQDGAYHLVGEDDDQSVTAEYTLPENTLSFGETYEWYVKVKEIHTAEKQERTSKTFSFTTMEYPNTPPVIPTTFLDGSILDGDIITVGDPLFFGVPIEDGDGDTIVVRFYMKNGAQGMLHEVTLSGSGDATYSGSSAGLDYNTTYTWWVTIDDGQATVETEKQTFTTAPMAMGGGTEPIEGSNEFPWLYALVIIVIIILLVMVYYRKPIKARYIVLRDQQKARSAKMKGRKQGKGKKQTPTKKEPTKTKASNVSTKPKKTAKPSSPKLAKTYIVAPIQKVIIFAKVMKGAARLGYDAVRSDIDFDLVKENNENPSGKCPFCKEVVTFTKKEVYHGTKTHWFCPNCNKYQPHLDDSGQLEGLNRETITIRGTKQKPTPTST